MNKIENGDRETIISIMKDIVVKLNSLKEVGNYETLNITIQTVFENANQDHGYHTEIYSIDKNNKTGEYYIKKTVNSQTNAIL